MRLVSDAGKVRGKVGAVVLPNIGLAGRAGSGKSLLAAELVKRGYVAISFANPVKWDVGQMILQHLPGRVGPLLPNPIDWVNAHKDACRPLLQAYGVAMREIVGPNIWIDTALEAVNRANVNGDPVVIDDARFPNEVAALQTAGLTVFGIDRPHWHRTIYGGASLTGELATHSSEAQIDDLPVDRWLVNDTTPAALLRKLDHYLAGQNG